MKTISTKVFRRLFKTLETIIDYRLAHTNTKNTLNFILMKIKNYYNAYYQLMFFKERNLIKLRLHREYNLSKIVLSKLRSQFIKSFKVINSVERLVYRLLTIISNIKIHNVVSVAQLKSITDSFIDSYKRRLSPLLVIIVDDKEENEIK